MRKSDYHSSESFLKRKLDASRSQREAKIINAAKCIIPSGILYFVITDTPEQTYDIIEILVDDKYMVGFELDRYNDAAKPVEINVFELDSFYRNMKQGRRKIFLKKLIEFVRRKHTG
jgi:hypothetical protein